jgi:plasmid stabilization system protein ParE
MGKIKEIDEIAERIAEATLQLIEDSVDWQIADQPTSGDDHEELREMVTFLAIEKMYMSTKRRYYEQD